MSILINIKTINEKSTAYFALSFTGKDGLPETPEAISYRIDCVTTGTAIKTDTSLSPAPSVELTVASDDNRIITASNENEKRVVTVTATYNGVEKITEQHEYFVRNLAYIS